MARRERQRFERLLAHQFLEFAGKFQLAEALLQPDLPVADRADENRVRCIGDQFCGAWRQGGISRQPPKQQAGCLRDVRGKFIEVRGDPDLAGHHAGLARLRGPRVGHEPGDGLARLGEDHFVAL